MSAAAAVGVLGWALWQGHPGDLEPTLHADSRSYAEWPEPFEIRGTRIMGQRPPVYPLFLAAIEDETSISNVQAAISVLSFGLLGWVLGAWLGVAACVLIALSPHVWMWNRILISESLSISLAAVGLATTLLLCRRRSLPRWIAWALALAGLGLVRDLNVILIPFLVLPVAWMQRRVAVPLATGAVVLAAGIFDISVHDRGHWACLNVVLARVLPDPEARDFFRERGMPLREEIERHSGKVTVKDHRELTKDAPDFVKWVFDHGRSTYVTWLATHPAAAWRAMDFYASLDDVDLVSRFASRMEPPLPARITRLAWAWPRMPSLTLLSVVAAAWCLLLGLRSRRAGRGIASVEPRSALALCTLCAAVFMVLGAYHGDGLADTRHMVPSMILHRLGALLLIASLAAELAGHLFPALERTLGVERGVIERGTGVGGRDPARS